MNQPKLNILAIDDDPLLIKSLRRATSRHNCTLVATSSPQEALLALRWPQPQLIMLDLQLGPHDALDLILAIPNPDKAPPVALMSGDDAPLLHHVAQVARSRGLNVVAEINKMDLVESLGPLLATLPRPAISIADEIGRAIADGQIGPHYQVIVDMKTGERAGAEALARWEHPDMGLIPPGAFLSRMTDDHLADLTLAIVSIMATDLDVLRGQGLRRLSFNVPPRLLAKDSFWERFRPAARNLIEGIDHCVIEMTEHDTAGDDAVKIAARLAQLRLDGAGLALDDFGTGFSSLERLQHLPFTELKVDRSLVSGAATSESREAVLRTALELARSLDLETVVEGIETVQERTLVAGLSAEFGQGYLFGRPVPRDALACASPVAA